MVCAELPLTDNERASQMNIADTPLDTLELSVAARAACKEAGAETLTGVLMLDGDSMPAKVWVEVKEFQRSLWEHFNKPAAARALQFVQEVLSLHGDTALLLHDGELRLIDLNPEEGGQGHD